MNPDDLSSAMNPIHFYPDLYLEDVFSVPYVKLYKAGYRALIFDIDNTLVPHGADSTGEVDRLLARLRGMGFKILLLSNNNEARILRFCKNIDALYIAEAGKPSATPFRKALEMTGVGKDRAVVIGDSTFTDIIGANRAGIPSILVKYIGHEKWEWKGYRRYLEKMLLWGRPFAKIIRKSRLPKPDKKLFCERGSLAYALSTNKQIFQRHVRNFRTADRFATKRSGEMLPVVVESHSSNMIKRGPGIDPVLQTNKAENIALACSKIDGLIVEPGESFSFWKLVGKTSESNGFKSGRILRNGKLVAGTGGGLCNLANTLHILFMHSPLTITELHHHSDALAPDPGGVRVPYSAGTSVNYNYLDLRFRNDTDRAVQIVARCEGDDLIAELRTTEPFGQIFRIVEEDHHFHKEENGYYYRKSKIYREIIDRDSGKLLKRELKWDNRSKVMFDPALIPADQIR